MKSFPTWQSRVPSTQTINIRTAILKNSAKTDLWWLKDLRPLHKELGFWGALLGKKTKLNNPENLPLASLLPFLLHLQPLSHSASFYPSASICLSQLFPIRDWGMSHSRGVQGVRISAVALPCTPAHVLSLTDGCGRGREGKKAMKGEAGQLLLQTEAPVISHLVSVNTVKNNNVTEKQRTEGGKKTKKSKTIRKNLNTNKGGNMKYNNTKPNDFQFAKALNTKTDKNRAVTSFSWKTKMTSNVPWSHFTLICS